MATGWTWEYAQDEVTLPILSQLTDYWHNEHPPLHVMVAAYLGYKPQEQKKGNIGDLISMFESAGGKIERKKANVQ